MLVSHGMPVIWRVVVLSLVWCVRTEKVRGDVDHGGGLAVKWRNEWDLVLRERAATKR